MSKVSELFPNQRPLNPSESGYWDRVISILTLDPPDVRINDKANNSLYVPVQVSEELLDFLFPGCWSWRHKNTQWIANEIVADGELEINTPTYKRTIWGAGAEPIAMKSKTNGGTGDPTNMADKIINTLAKDYPNAKSETFKNACKMLGNVFGRNLNRKNADKTAYEPERVLDNGIVDNLNFATDLSVLNAMYLNLPNEFRSDKKVIALFSARKAALSATPTTPTTQPTTSLDL